MDLSTGAGGFSRFRGYLDDRPQAGVSRVDRSIFTDPELFELELETIWEGNWIYLAHESQIPNPGDFMTLFMGRQPIVLNRDHRGEIGAFINACSHRGTTLVREMRGNRLDFSCPFHGWCFDSTGALQAVVKPDDAGYPPQFDTANYHLKKVPRLAAYRGFIFGSLNSDVPALEQHLGPAARGIDFLADQSEEGLEVLRGFSTYTFDGNWKLQAENGVDGYHLYATHGNYVMTTERRRRLRGELDGVKSMQVGNIGRQQGGYLDLGHGHVMLWGDWPNPQDRPNYRNAARYRERFGEERARWMVGRLRNLLLYPNVFLMDQMSSQIRVFRPLAVDRTEVTIYAIAPRDEAPAQRAHRIRQYEDFFNASGMATPDDLMEFNQSQIAYQGRAASWNDMCRGLEHRREGPAPQAQAAGFASRSYGLRLEDEGIFTVQHRRWLELMEGAAGPAGTPEANR